MGESQEKRLYRSNNEKVLGGVCGGLSEYYNMNPTIIRLLWVLITFLTLGIGIFVYAIAWVIIPENPTDLSRPLVKRETKPLPPRDGFSTVVGVTLVVLGRILLLHALDVPPWGF